MEMSFISMDCDVSQRALAAVEESAILRTERKRLLIQARILREQRKGARSLDPVLTAIADATSVYFRYEGDISSQDSNHALTAGFRMTW